MLDTYIVPRAYGTTVCEYSVACTTQTRKVVYLGVMLGSIPMCQKCIDFYQRH